MFVDDPQPRTGFNNILRAEADAVLSKPVLRRSPVLSKLLRYLVEETANGRAEKLKSFVVATEALGRPDSFDAASDSSARVQMVRLRKTLENHYAQHGPFNELCIYLQPGSYVVRLGKLATAYPMLYRPLVDILPTAALTSTEHGADFCPVHDDLRFDQKHSKSSASLHMAAIVRGHRLKVAIALVVIIAAAAAVYWYLSSRNDRSISSPILEVMPINAGRDADNIRVAGLVNANFHDNLPRFKLARIRVLDDRTQQPTYTAGEYVFRLYSRLEHSSANRLDLYVHVREGEKNTTIWSRKITLPDNPDAISDALAPLLPQISGPFGIVTTHNITRYKSDNRGGYPCVLKYVTFMAHRTDDLEKKLALCFEMPVGEEYVRSNVLAARAMFTIERTAARLNLPAARHEAMEHARAAIAADPDDAYANYAVARLSYGARDCVSANFYTKRAVDANPNSPIILGTLSALAGECDYPDAAKLLDRAILLQNPHMGNNRLLLVLAALSQGRPDKLAEIGPTDLPTASFYRQRYYLAETLIAASQGKRAEAGVYWSRFSEYAPAGSNSPEEMLHPIIAFPDMQKKLINYLRSSGVRLDRTKK